MDYKYILVSADSRIAEIRLNLAARRNPLSYVVLEELAIAFGEIGCSEADAVILSADGPVFSAGHDFSDMADRDLEQMRNLMHLCLSVMKAIRSASMPVIAKVQGHALGAGCQLVLSCDFVVMAEEASLFTPGGKGGWFCTTPMVALTRSVGRKRALEMLMSGEPTTAQTAYDWGMVNRVVPLNELDVETDRFVALLTRGSRSSRIIGKRAFYHQLELDENRAYEYATELMASSGTLPDAKETIAAFLEKRKANFKE